MTSRGKLRQTAPIVATLVTAATMAGVMLPGWITPVPRLPVVTATVPAGTPLTAADFRWIKANKVPSYPVGRSSHVARTTLTAGEVLTAALVSTGSHGNEPRTLVEVTPSVSAEANLGRWVDRVEVLVVKAGRIIWNSGPCSVVSSPTSLLSAGSSTIGVWLTPKAALTYTKTEGLGTVSVIGIAP